MEQLPTILGGLILAAILWVLKGTRDNSQALAVLQSTMEKVVLPELSRLRDSGHELRDLAQEAVSVGDLLTQRATQIERDVAALWKDHDRRNGDDRREPRTA